MPLPDSLRVCVIGAGSSGIAATKVLHERGLDVTSYETSDRVGGNWVLGNPNGTSAAYRSLHINTSKRRMAFSDFPMPEHYPQFARHDQVAAYFEAYVERFGLRERMRFGATVTHVEPRVSTARSASADGFDVDVAGEPRQRFDAVVVANGHHWDARLPDPMPEGAERFAGEQWHAHEYRDESQLAGRRVVVVGMGNSAMDIAVDASYHAASTVLSHRRGAHIIPKYLFGYPFDAIASGELLPSRLRWWAARPLVRIATGPMSRYGLREPDHPLAHAHPTVSSRILDRLAHGAIDPRPGIARIEPDAVVFTDGSRAPADLIVYCTGYRISFPFLDPAVIDPGEDNAVRLYRRVFHPAHPRLTFVGLVQPLGAVMPIAERQSQLIADELTGVYALPSRAEMEREIDGHARAMARRYVASTRHTIQVDFDDEMRALRTERRRGAARAERRSGRRRAATPTPRRTASDAEARS